MKATHIIVDIHPDDAFYGDKDHLIGLKVGNVTRLDETLNNFISYEFDLDEDRNKNVFPSPSMLMHAVKLKKIP